MQAIIEQTRLTDNGNVQALIVFTDNSSIKTLPSWVDINAVDLASFVNQLQSLGNAIPGRLTFAQSLTPGQVIDLTVTTIPPDPAVVAKNKYFHDLDNYQKLQNLVTLGILIGNEKEISNLKSTVQNEYLASYYT